MNPYWEKLKDPRWQKKRLEILERDNFTCLNCGCKETTLHVHHGCYLKDRDPWDYAEDIFLTLCEKCHQRQTDIQKALKIKMAKLLPWQLDSIDILLEFNGMEIIHQISEAIKMAHNRGSQ